METLIKCIKDIIPVIFGILIALVINNWNEERKEKKYLDQIFTSINKELEESSLSIEENLPKQQILSDSIMAYLDDETVPIFDIIKKANGIYGPTIKNNSWRAIANSKIELVEFKKLSTLTEIDQSKEFLQLKLEKLLDFMIENLKSTTKEKKEIFLLLNQEITSSSSNLKEEIEDFLKN